ncbi:hypothetical protein VNO80_24426 [Phaseolus coccineus]|uniref:Uncharacterized protein n=1 Tax=Phaseolus coccineus TaxID=3886 RepID=A0AAN9QL10_PHACN
MLYFGACLVCVIIDHISCSTCMLFRSCEKKQRKIFLKLCIALLIVRTQHQLYFVRLFLLFYKIVNHD